jgi:electron transport complex protein RnfD
MLHAIAACLPGLIALCYFFGYGTLVQVALAAVTALLAEAAVAALRQRSVKAQLSDYSALLTALLLGLSLPPLAPWWLIILATLCAIVIAKQLYGGLGHNPFNPAMVGYVIVLVSFPVQMTSWLPEGSLQLHHPAFTDTLSLIFFDHARGLNLEHWRLGLDGMTQATPLDNFKTGLHSGQAAAAVLHQPVYNGLEGGLGWQWINLAFALGGMYLLWRKIINWHIPVSFLATLMLCSTTGWLWAPQTAAPPLLHLLSGATMLGAFFIATDPVTAATTNRGRLIYGAIAGLLVWLIRTYGGYPEGVAFAVLLANICVPLIDHFTQPRAYGHR